MNRAEIITALKNARGENARLCREAAKEMESQDEVLAQMQKALTRASEKIVKLRKGE